MDTNSITRKERGKISEGKTKIIYKTDDLYKAEIFFKDVLTAGDGGRKEIFEGIGSFKNDVTCNIFKYLEMMDIKTHFLEKKDSQSFHALLCDLVPAEVVVRDSAPPGSGYLMRYPEVREGAVFKFPIVEFFLKDDTRHDPFIYSGGSDTWKLFHPKKPVMDGGEIGEIPALLSLEEEWKVRTIALGSFKLLKKAFSKVGVDLHDFKIEFGKVKYGHSAGNLVIADCITPDEFRVTEGGAVLDKQLFRNGGDPGIIMENYARVAMLTGRFFKGIDE